MKLQHVSYFPSVYGKTAHVSHNLDALHGVGAAVSLFPRHFRCVAISNGAVYPHASHGEASRNRLWRDSTKKKTSHHQPPGKSAHNARLTLLGSLQGVLMWASLSSRPEESGSTMVSSSMELGVQKSTAHGRCSCLCMAFRTRSVHDVCAWFCSADVHACM